MKKLSMDALGAFLSEVARERRVYLPIERAGQVDFAPWEAGANVRLDALKTARSAKDLFFPQVENLMRFRMEGKRIEMEAAERCEEDFVLFGVRGCDARSFDILDSVFLTEPRDEAYAARRAHCTVVALACAYPEESCFCTNFGIDPAEPEGDATAWMVGEALYLRANTAAGEALLAPLEEADDAPVAAERERIAEIVKRLPLAKLPLEGFAGGRLLEKFDDPSWDELSRACLGCGTCTFVCPTCQCYDIRDFDSGREVTRYRCWDSCMYSDFTLMAAENSRTTQMQRYRQRFMHKLVYHPANHEGVYACVGCGRCVEKCPQGLNIVRVIRTLGEGKHDE